MRTDVTKKIFLIVQKDFPNRTKRFSWSYKKILLSVQKDSPDGTKTFYWAYKKIFLIVQNHFTEVEWPAKNGASFNEVREKIQRLKEQEIKMKK